MNNSISAHDAHSLITRDKENTILIDVRSAGEFRSRHAAPAVHLPLEELSSPEALERLKNKKVICICQSGARGERAIDALKSRGLSDAVNVEGGTVAWSKENLPVIEGQGTISIERQVRIAAGAFVLFGSILGILVSPYLLGIPIFVGAGLLFSGITDTCGLALVLGRCPWNSK